MKRGQLVDFFEGVGVKRLTAVDAEPNTSNQHEIGTTRQMRHDFLGEYHQRKFETTYIWLGDDHDIITVEAWARHYDSRIKKPMRAPEWRLYYPSNSVTDAMEAGDTLFLAKKRTGQLLFIVAQRGSTCEQQLFWLFGLRPETKSFLSRGITKAEPELGFSARYIFEGLGIDFEVSDESKLHEIIQKLGNKFPPTQELSKLARQELLEEVSVLEDPDTALMEWLNFEKDLFLLLERHDVSKRLEKGFVSDEAVDVDGFIRFSLSVQNRRKSRMGRSLENHIEAVLDAHKIDYERGVITENKTKPDFLFPGQEAYLSSPRGSSGLTMLGAKSTCKDRWRQVLSEAAKIPKKHLLTLEPAITESQTSEMQTADLQLVVPQQIQKTYTSKQQGWLLSVQEFIDEVAHRQAQACVDLDLQTLPNGQVRVE